jgi:hypothetical protein
LGTTLIFDFLVQPGHYILILFGLPGPPIPTPPVQGALKINGLALFQFPFFPVPVVSGELNLALPLPADLIGVVGVSITFQAIDVNVNGIAPSVVGSAYTNAATFTITP